MADENSILLYVGIHLNPRLSLKYNSYCETATCVVVTTIAWLLIVNNIHHEFNILLISTRFYSTCRVYTQYAVYVYYFIRYIIMRFYVTACNNIAGQPDE